MVTIKSEGGTGKILIIGQTLDKLTGGGITISNLLSGIHSENIAVITSPKQAPKTNDELCRRVYQLGTEELKVKFPLSLLYPAYKSGPVKVIEQNSNRLSIENSKRVTARAIFITLAHFFGIYHFLYKLELSGKLRTWIQEFNPDFIYTQLSTRELINFTEVITNEYKKPLIIHIMDDWLLTINKVGIFRHMWDRIIDKEFRNLLKLTNSRLCISDAMSEEYSKRFGGSWLSFHNPVMNERWIPFQKNTYTKGLVFKILYSGRIGNANINSILAFCELINELKRNGMSIVFSIYSPEYNLEKFRKYDDSPAILLNKPLKHDEMPELYSKFDLLFLPIDFDKLSIKFTRFSMPTKISEYMISGVPILIHAPEEIAIVKFAAKYNIAIISSKNGIGSLREILLDLINNDEARQKVALNAVSVASDKFDGIKVRKNFQSLFMK